MRKTIIQIAMIALVLCFLNIDKVKCICEESEIPTTTTATCDMTKVNVWVRCDTNPTVCIPGYTCKKFGGGEVKFCVCADSAYALENFFLQCTVDAECGDARLACDTVDKLCFLAPGQRCNTVLGINEWCAYDCVGGYCTSYYLV